MEQKNMFDKNTILVVIICLGIWWGWQQHLERKYPETMGSARTQVSQTGEKPEQSNAGTAPQYENKTESVGKATKTSAESSELTSRSAPEKKWTFEDNVWRVVVSSYGGRISEVALKKYTDKTEHNVILSSKDDPGFLLVGLENPQGKAAMATIPFELKSSSQNSVELESRFNGVVIKKIFQFLPEKYIIKSHIDVVGDLKSIARVNIDVAEPLPPTPDDKGPSFLNPRSADIQEYFFAHGTKTNREVVTQKESVEKSYDQAHFASIGSRYFTAMIFNRGNILPDGRAFRLGKVSVLRMSYPVIDSSNPLALDFDFYAGPKSVHSLSEVDETAAKVVDFGTFSVIAHPLLQLMKWLFSLFRNYGVAIIVLTVLVRLVTFPFTYMSYKSMKAMQVIQPQIARLKETYKDNSAALNQEMIKLMRENKVNPMGGCLPMLLQLPVFWALYQVLQNSIELYHSPFVGWIHDLSMKDPYYVLPILMGASMFIQQKLTPNTMDPAQARVMLIMPVFFSLLMFGLPSGLTLYIFVSTLFGIVQQFFMMRGKETKLAPQPSH